MKKNLVILGILFILALGIRTISLNIRPLGFTWDEAALGYNAYSLLRTGRDEHQKVIPIVFESFGDYKPGAYIYLTVPSVALMGLNEFATRFPSALLGSLSVVLIWFLVREILGKEKAIFASLIMTFNPWSIYFSRGAWEANMMVFLLLVGTVLALRKKVLLASVFWGLTLWTYQGAKMITPLLIVGWWAVFGERVAVIRTYWKPALILAFFGLPILLGLKTQSGRLQVANVFNYTRTPTVINTIMSQDNQPVGSLIYYVFHSEKLDQITGVIGRYLNHFSPRFLFFEGNWQDMRESIAYYGYFHLPEALLLIVGSIFLFSLENKLGIKFLLWWLIVAALPSALSRDLVSGVRSLPLSIPFMMLISLGLYKISRYKIALLAYLAVMLFFFGMFCDLYFKQAPNYKADETLTFYKPAIELIDKYQDQYANVIFTNKFGQPYIFVLFYNKVDPRDFWKSVARVSSTGVDVGQVTAFGKWQFKSFYWPDMRSIKSTIVVGDAMELPESDLHFPNLTILDRINYPNGLQALSVVAMP